MPGDLILTFNAGSSTVKLGFHEIAGDVLRPLAQGVIDFRDEPFEIRLKRDGRTLACPLEAAGRSDISAILSRSFAWLAGEFDLSRIVATGHRVVHGGERFTGPVLVGDESLAAMEALSRLAPLHQPQALALIRAMRQLRPDLPLAASFDTAFHASQDPLARRFAIPRALHDAGIRRYGFHGLSYRYIAEELARQGLASESRVVVAHLGSGASLCAMQGGVSRDTSMGFSTLDGIPMATRSGALDPGVILHLMGQMGWSRERVEKMLYHESGLLGVSGFEADSRDLLASDRPEAAEAIALFCFRIAGEVARLSASLQGLDALVFTAGIGENQPRIRAMVAERLAWMGLRLDEAANLANARRLDAPGSRIGVWVLPTDEEQVIAGDAWQLCRTAS